MGNLGPFYSLKPPRSLPSSHGILPWHHFGPQRAESALNSPLNVYSLFIPVIVGRVRALQQRDAESLIQSSLAGGLDTALALDAECHDAVDALLLQAIREGRIGFECVSWASSVLRLNSGQLYALVVLATSVSLAAPICGVKTSSHSLLPRTSDPPAASSCCTK